MSLRMACAALLVTLCGAVPALAANSSAVSEPSSLVLLGLGAAGVIIGRRGGRPRRD